MTLNPVFNLIAITARILVIYKKKKGQNKSDLSCLVVPRVEDSNQTLLDLKELATFHDIK